MGVSSRRLVVDLMSSSPHMRLPQSGAEQLRARAPAGWEVVVIEATTLSTGEGTNTVSAETRSAVQTAEVYFGFGASAALIEAAPALKWVHSAAAGVTGSITPALLRAGIVLTNSAAVYAEGIADTVLAGVLHFVRGLDYAVHQQAESRWDQTRFTQASTPLQELNQCRILVIGAGGIGSACAVRFAALGCTCVGIRRRPELGVPAGFARVTSPDALQDELVTADVVVLAAPLTTSSHALLNAHHLALLPPSAIVVNVARGGLVADDALLDALDAGRLRGAVLDVFDTEPLPAESPYWRHPSVLVTPHVSGVSPKRWERALDLFEDNWQRWGAGEPLRNVVNFDVGY